MLSCKWGGRHLFLVDTKIMSSYRLVNVNRECRLCILLMITDGITRSYLHLQSEKNHPHMAWRNSY